MSIRLAIFDLDGTLLDTSPGILESVCYAAEKLGYPSLPRERLLTFIGPPLKASFMRCWGCDEAEAERLTEAYREHYRGGALLYARPYEGIAELLEALRQDGLRLAVATNKPQAFSERILRHFELDRCFHVIHGADFEGQLTKADLIRACAADAGADASDCVMIGDTEHDARGAEEAGVPFLAVTYGFGFRRAEDVSFPHVGTADSPAGIRRILDETESE
ncbi:MAG: HAD-IA family hydrolase [Oscillospiraceae bacterium]|nr:HAD-IA family hydrolase [Oscillospiraceae bacterium]